MPTYLAVLLRGCRSKVWTQEQHPVGLTGAHGREDALVYWSQQQGLAAEPLRIEAYEDSELEGE